LHIGSGFYSLPENAFRHLKDERNNMKFNPNEHIIFETIAGSHLYGTNIEGSDFDKRGVCVPPYRILFNPFQKFDQLEETVYEDRVIYSLAKFFDLATQNNPNIIELLFAPKGSWIQGSWQWELLVENRNLFLSRNAAKTFGGYARAQMHKLKNGRQEGSKRFELVQQYGYDTKSAMHLVRLVIEGTELLNKGTITLPCPNAAQLLKIRNGGFSYKNILLIAEDFFSVCDELAANGPLPDKAEYDRLADLYLEIVAGTNGRI